MVCAMSAMARAKFARGYAAMSKAERHRRREALRTCPFKDQHRPQVSDDVAATTLYAASGRLIPFSTNSPTGSTFTTSSTFVSTRGLMRICPGFASSHSREATLDTVPMAA